MKLSHRNGIRHADKDFRAYVLLCAWLSMGFASPAADTSTPADLAGGKDAENATETARPVIKFQILEQKRINLGNRSLIINRVVPPVLPELPPPPPPSPPPTADEIAAAKAAWERQPHKKYEILFLSATVYDHQVTEVRWNSNGRELRIFTNIDFNNLRGVGQFETADAEYSLLMGIGDASRKDASDWNQYVDQEGWPVEMKTVIPEPSAFPAGRSSYMVLPEDRRAEALAWNRYADKQGLPKEDRWTVPEKAQETDTDLAGKEEALAAIDALHVYYDSNKERLIADSAKVKAANDERERFLKEHPPVPKDTIINYWLGEGGTGTRVLRP